MTKTLIRALTLSLFGVLLSFNQVLASGSKTIAPTHEDRDWGIVTGAFAPKMKTVKAGSYTYNVIAPDLIEPACNSSQIVLWVEDATLEGDAGGVAYNLGYQISAVQSAKAVGDELEIKYTVNNIDDCSTSVKKTVYLKYPGAAGALSVRE